MQDQFVKGGAEAALYYAGMARKNIERVLGPSAADRYPQIVAAMITAAAQDAHTKQVLGALSGVEHGLMEIADAIGALASTVEDMPAQAGAERAP